jgi:GDPmannose 4,6-dehydratase
MVTGITGQDGWYLASALLREGHHVVGITRHPADSARVHPGIATSPWGGEPAELERLVLDCKPDEFYNLGAMSRGSGKDGDLRSLVEANALAVGTMLDCLRSHAPACRFLQASSSEVFGACPTAPQDERSERRPRNNYGVSKLMADHLVRIARERYGQYAVSAILYNHESPRRPLDYLTRKLTHAAAEVALGLRSTVELADLGASRDWGFAGDYVEAMRLSLASDVPEDYVVATGQLHTVRDVCETAFSFVGLDYRQHVRESPGFAPRFEPGTLVGDSGKIRSQLGWTPGTDFRGLIEMMVAADLEAIRANTGD